MDNGNVLSLMDDGSILLIHWDHLSGEKSREFRAFSSKIPASRMWGVHSHGGTPIVIIGQMGMFRNFPTKNHVKNGETCGYPHDYGNPHRNTRCRKYKSRMVWVIAAMVANRAACGSESPSLGPVLSSCVIFFAHQFDISV